MANNSKNEHSRVFSVSKDEKGINTVDRDDREPNECHKAVKAEPSQAAATLTMALPSNREDAIVPFELLPTSRDPIRKRVNGAPVVRPSECAADGHHAPSNSAAAIQPTTIRKTP